MYERNNGEVSLLEAVSECFHFKSKSKELVFEIRFKDVSRTIKFGKHWGKVSKEFQYFIQETYGPCLASTEDNFIGHLANTSGVALGYNIPDYTVVRLS